MNKLILWLISTFCVLIALSPMAQANEETILIELDPYDRLELNGAFRVHLYQGNKEEIKLVGPDQLLDRLEVNQNGNRVRVESRHQERASLKKVDVFVHFRDLSKLEINGIGRFVCETIIRSESLHIITNGIKELDLELYVGDLRAEVMGMGRTYFAGTAEVARIYINGIGNLDAFDLEAQELHIETNGIGKAEVHATDELYVSAAGIGSVWYIGDPEIKSMDKSGIGKVKKAD